MKDEGEGQEGRGVQAPSHQVPYLESCSQQISLDALTVS